MLNVSVLKISKRGLLLLKSKLFLKAMHIIAIKRYLFIPGAARGLKNDGANKFLTRAIGAIFKIFPKIDINDAIS